MQRKKSGFTLIEVVIALTLTVIILGIIGTFFQIGSSIVSNTFIKSELQTESKNIEEKILSFGMGAKDVESVELYNDENSQNIKYIPYDDLAADNNKVIIKKIVIKSLTEDENNNIISTNHTLEYDKGNKTLKIDNNEDNLLENVESFEIKPANPKQSFADCSTLNINVTLSKRKHEVKTSFIKVNSNMTIVFRNKGMEEERRKSDES